MSEEIDGGLTIRSLAAQIVMAYVGHSSIPADRVPSLLKEVYATLAEVGNPPAPGTGDTPAVPVNKSVFRDHLVCLNCGTKVKMLKRHLLTSYAMTPEDYRAKWGLPASYPMVAPDYAKVRSNLAKESGLGHRRGVAGSKTPKRNA